MEMMVDVGAQHSVISAPLARRLGLMNRRGIGPSRCKNIPWAPPAQGSLWGDDERKNRKAPEERGDLPEERRVRAGIQRARGWHAIEMQDRVNYLMEDWLDSLSISSMVVVSPRSSTLVIDLVNRIGCVVRRAPGRQVGKVERTRWLLLPCSEAGQRSPCVRSATSSKDSPTTTPAKCQRHNTLFCFLAR